MHKARFWLVCLVLLSLPGIGAQADTLFSNFGAGDAYNTSTGWTVSGPTSPVGQQQMAFSFTLGDACYRLDTIELAAFWVTGPNSLLVKVLEDNGGLPGSEIESFSFTNLVSNSSILLGTSVLNPELAANTTYWLAAFPGGSDTWAAWNHNSIGDTTPGAFSTNGGLNWSSMNDTASAFRITGTKCSENPVPEPSSLLALMSGLPLAGYMLRRRRS